VTVIAANVLVDLPTEVSIRRVETTGQLRAEVLGCLVAPDGRPGLDALVMAAAVADFAPAAPALGKLERGAGTSIRLEPTPDILAEVARIARGLDTTGAATRAGLEPRPVLVGFAAEAGSLDRVPDKLARKQVDLVIANDITAPGSGFGSDTNRVTIFEADGAREDLPLLDKREVADRVLDRIVRRLADRDAGAGASRQRSALDVAGPSARSARRPSAGSARHPGALDLPRPGALDARRPSRQTGRAMQEDQP
jgi:phosphopantothenoylcysteine decarboxylase/phosphopantothenate--cysteine ligase